MWLGCLHPSCRAQLLATLIQELLHLPSTHARSEPCAPSLLHYDSSEHTQEARNIDDLGSHLIPRGATSCHHHLVLEPDHGPACPARTSGRPVSPRLLSFSISALTVLHRGKCRSFEDPQNLSSTAKYSGFFRSRTTPHPDRYAWLSGSLPAGTGVKTYVSCGEGACAAAYR